MKTIFKCIFALLLVTSIPTLVIASITRIVGVGATNNPPPPPTGCTPTSTFNMVAGSPSTIFTFSNGATNGYHRVDVDPTYNNNGGIVYQVLPNLISGNIDSAQTLLYPSPAYTGNTNISTANNPDRVNTYGTINDTVNHQLVIHATQIVAPCNINACLHLITLTPGATGPTYQSFTYSSILVGQSTVGGIADQVNGWYFFLHQNVGGTATNLYKFKNTLAFINSVSLGVSAGSSTMLADDGTNVWLANLNQLIQVNKSTLTVTSFTVAGITTFLGPIQYDATNNVLYAMDSGSGTNPVIQRISITTPTITGSIGLASSDLMSQNGFNLDTVAGKLYVLTENSGTRNLRRIDTTNFNIEQNFGVAEGTASYNGSPDFIHKRYFISDMDSPSHLHPITLCS